MSRISLLYLVSSLGRTGPTKQLYNLTKYLDKSIFDISIVTLSPEDNNTYWNEFSQLNVSLTSLNLSRIVGIVAAVPILKKIILSINPDIIHTQGIRPDIISTFFSEYRIRYSTQRNDPLADYPLQYGRILGSLIARLHNRTLNNIPYIVSCSNTIFELNQQRELFGSYICNGVDLSLGQRILNRSEKLDMRRTLGLDSRGLLFVVIGPLINRKATDVIVRAIADYLPNFSGTLCILGSGPQLDYCKSIAKGKTSIVFRGFVKNVDQYLMAADTLLSASRSEGMPNSILEALAWGIPIIATDIPPHREILRVDPTAGLVFSVDSPVDLARNIQHFRYNKKIQIAARRIVEKEFSANLMAAKYQEKYIKTVTEPKQYLRDL